MPVLGDCVKTKFLSNNSHLHKCCGSSENTAWGLVQRGENWVGCSFTKDSALTAVLGFGGSGFSYMGFPLSCFWLMKVLFCKRIPVH